MHKSYSLDYQPMFIAVAVATSHAACSKLQYAITSQTHCPCTDDNTDGDDDRVTSNAEFPNPQVFPNTISHALITH